MAKRKVADLGEGDAVTTRRSSRRRTAEIEREEVGKTKANGTAMKGQKAEEVNANNIKVCQVRFSQFRQVILSGQAGGDLYCFHMKISQDQLFSRLS